MPKEEDFPAREATSAVSGAALTDNMHRLLLGLILSFSAFGGGGATTSPPQTCTSPDGIQSICKLVTGHKSPASGVPFDFCVKSLEPSPSDDPHELAAAATKLAVTHAVGAESEMEELLELEADSRAKLSLDACLNAYADAAEHLRDALDNISIGVYKKAAQLLGIAAGGAAKCRSAFGQGSSKGAPPLPKAVADGDYAKLASIAQGIVVKSLRCV
ncbi:hypothetical protein ZIOFF_059117 [Zingiber officinale]|uniref:Pectinesterase inhibitor domain-containing protein n=2 Tax=Zingiber officinale TaxID=94328 RepID=A0A8J5F736_ZINOF|nr:hypothetical protein ZIOFF_059117 [Zingiber officinale]